MNNVYSHNDKIKIIHFRNDKVNINFNEVVHPMNNHSIALLRLTKIYYQLNMIKLQINIS